MAEFCRQCTMHYFGPEWADRNDFVNAVPPPDDVHGYTMDVLCEGCGPTTIDHTGACIYHDAPNGCQRDTTDWTCPQCGAVYCADGAVPAKACVYCTATPTPQKGTP
jgi:hypothetical protein